jgi:hypothetical protein
MFTGKVREFDEALLERICSVVKPGDQIPTLTSKRPNRIVSIDTEGSQSRPFGPTTVGLALNLYLHG